MSSISNSPIYPNQPPPRDPEEIQPKKAVSTPFNASSQSQTTPTSTRPFTLIGSTAASTNESADNTAAQKRMNQIIEDSVHKTPDGSQGDIDYLNSLASQQANPTETVQKLEQILQSPDASLADIKMILQQGIKA